MRAMARCTPIAGLLAALGLAAVLSGCAGQARYDRRVLLGETFTINGPQMLLTTPMVAEAQAQAEAQGRRTHDAWWTDRNDAWLNVRRDQPTGERVYYVIRTRNHLRTYGDHVYDIYRQTTDAVRYGQSIR